MEYIRFEHTGEKLLSILHTVQGWIVAGVLFVLDFIAGHELAVGLVVAVTLMDAIWGITVSIKRKKFALSELARLTVGLVSGKRRNAVSIAHQTGISARLTRLRVTTICPSPCR